jgi:hypothetical protein
MKITDPITSIDIKSRLFHPMILYPDSYQRRDSPRFVPSDSVPFSLRQSLLELLSSCDFCEFRLHLPKTTNRTPTNSTRQEKISCLFVYQRPPLYHKHEQPSFDLHNGCLHGPESCSQVGVQVCEEEEGLQVYLRRHRTINCKSC